MRPQFIVLNSGFPFVFDAIRRLMQKPRPEPEKPRRIGFHVREKMAQYGAGKRRQEL